jgi:ABC-type Fe3+/spermidine/putrescine transport system ATPase subunit
MMPTMIRLERVSKSFGAVRAVASASIEVGRGEFVALLGPSGCGKTTLLRLIAGFEVPDDGTIRIGQQVVAGGTWVSPERRHVGMVFQDYALFPHLSVARNVGYGLARRGRDRRVREALELVGLAGHGDRFPHELSGGQQQRVAIARALASKPTVIFADEPTGNLDSTTGGEILELLRESVEEYGQTTVMVTHEARAAAIADRVLFLADGLIVKELPRSEPHDVLSAMESIAAS